MSDVRRATCPLILLMSISAAPVHAGAMCAGDIDGSGDVGFPDLTALLNAWGPCAASTVTIEPYVGAEWKANGFSGLTAFRLYANLPPGTQVVGAGSGTAPLEISSSNGVFVNSTVADALTAPADLTGKGVWENQWDTFVTVGTDDSDGDVTLLSGGFGTATNGLGTSFSLTGAFWIAGVPTAPQAFVGPDGRILLGQFVVAAGVSIDGTVTVAYDNGQLVTEVTGEFTSSPSPCDAADLDGSGDVGFPDLTALLNAWGSCR